MKKLNDYSEEVNKCTKCGLCQSACPVFETTGLETAVSRGVFAMLNGIIHGKLKFNKNVNRNLARCLGCAACNELCPSGIKAEKIIAAAKFEGYGAEKGNNIKKIVVKLFDSKFALNLLKISLNLYRLFRLDRMKYSNRFCIGRTLNLMNQQVTVSVDYKDLKPIKPLSALKIAYFPGCINEFINPSTKNSVMMVLKKNGINVSIPAGLSCCGMPALSAGDLATFTKHAKQNLDKIPEDIDYLVTDCASCGSVWNDYAEILEDEYKEKAEIIASKTLNITKLLSNLDLYVPETSGFKLKVTYHDPCHLKRFQGVSEEPRNILKQLPNIEFIEMDEADKCCGAAGSYCLVNQKISKAISKKKAENILNSKADAVITSCPSCKMGLFQGLLENNKSLPIYQLAELLAMIYRNSSVE